MYLRTFLSGASTHTGLFVVLGNLNDRKVAPEGHPPDSVISAHRSVLFTFFRGSNQALCMYRVQKEIFSGHSSAAVENVWSPKDGGLLYWQPPCVLSHRNICFLGQALRWMPSSGTPRSHLGVEATTCCLLPQSQLFVQKPVFTSSKQFPCNFEQQPPQPPADQHWLFLMPRSAKKAECDGQRYRQIFASASLVIVPVAKAWGCLGRQR